MKRTVFYSLIISLLIACHQKPTNYNDQIEVLDSYSQLDQMVKTHKNKTVVLNFWATTCPPCIREMPLFKKVDGGDIKVILASLDNVKDFEKRVIPFVKKHNITPEVVLLADDNYSAWTDEIDPSWFGALPATIIIDGDKRHFHFGAYESVSELENDIDDVSK